MAILECDAHSVYDGEGRLSDMARFGSALAAFVCGIGRRCGCADGAVGSRRHRNVCSVEFGSSVDVLLQRGNLSAKRGSSVRRMLRVRQKRRSRVLINSTVNSTPNGRSVVPIAVLFRSASRNTFGFCGPEKNVAQTRTDSLADSNQASRPSSFYTLPQIEFLNRLSIERDLFACVSLHPFHISIASSDEIPARQLLFVYLHLNNSSLPTAQAMKIVSRVAETCVLTHAVYYLISQSLPAPSLLNTPPHTIASLASQALKYNPRLARQVQSSFNGRVHQRRGQQQQQQQPRFDVRIVSRRRRKSRDRGCSSFQSPSRVPLSGGDDMEHAQYLEEVRDHVVRSLCENQWVLDRRDFGGGANSLDIAHRMVRDDADEEESFRAKFALLWVEGGVKNASFGLEIARGPAAGHQDILGCSLRRPRSGVLGSFALKSRQVQYETAMEPEISFLMSSFSLGFHENCAADVSQGAKHACRMSVLDPFCGSCSLLLSAAEFGYSELCGVDLFSVEDADTRQAFLSEFEARNLALPTLFTADSIKSARKLKREQQLSCSRPRQMPSSPWLLHDYYDAIVCDPPYGMKAPVSKQPAEHWSSSSVASYISARRDNQQLESDEAVCAVITIAQFCLRTGGRVVFFYSQRGSNFDPVEKSSCPHYILERLGEADLKLLIALPQHFSKTARRWLIVALKHARPPSHSSGTQPT